MKGYRLSGIAFLCFMLFVTGCAKKTVDQANLSGTGYDSLTSKEDLTQLPQTTGATTAQQGAVEVLPIETSPVTQSPVPASITPPASDASGTAASNSSASPTPASSSTALSRDQQIQTALKNAGLYQGKIDGKIGPRTKKAIEAFQTNHGLKADGKVGPKTWAALEAFLNGSPSTAAAPEAASASSPATAE